MVTYSLKPLLFGISINLIHNGEIIMKALLFVAGLVVATWSSKAGLEVGFTSDALESLKKDALPSVLHKIGNIQIPEQQATVGKDYYKTKIKVYNIVVSGIDADIDSSEIQFKPDHEFAVKINGITAKANFQYHYDVDSIESGGGSGDIDISDTNADAVVEVTESKGKPVVAIESSNVTLGKLDIKFGNDPLGYIANFLISLFKQKLTGTLEQEINKAIKNSGQKAIDKALSTLPIYISFGGIPLAVDYSLPSDPLVRSDYVQASAAGIFLDTDHPNYSPPVSPPVDLPGFDANGKQIQVMLTDYTLNTGLYACYKVGIINYNITSSVIPSKYPVHLDTTSLSIPIPGLEKKYGAGKPCNLWCYASEQPSIKSTSGEIQGNIEVNCEVQVEGVYKVATFGNSIDFSASAVLKDWVVSGSLKKAEIQSIKVVDNPIGSNIDAKALKNFFDLILKVVVPILDVIVLDQGIPLPKIKQVDLSNSEVTIQEGYLFIEATPVWHFD